MISPPSNAAVQAALLPVLEPIAQTGLIAGVLASNWGKTGTGTLDVVEISGPGPAQQTDKVSFTIGAGIQEQGTIRSKPVSSQLVLQPTLHMGGPDAPEDLALKLDGNVFHVDGRLGSVEAHLTGVQGDTGWHLEGTLDGEAYMVDSVLHNDPPKPGQPIPGTLTVRGKLGSTDISKDYTWVTTEEANGETTTAHGTGSVAGVPEQIDALYHFTPAA